MTSSCARFGVGFGRLGAAFDGSGKHIDHHRAKPFFFSVLPGAFCHGQLVVFVCAMFEFHLWVGRTPAWSLPFWFRRDAIHFWYAVQFGATRRNPAQFGAILRPPLCTTSVGT